MSKIKRIEWSKENKSGDKCPYDHVIGTTPLGEYLITWKSWKIVPTFSVDDGPFNKEMGVYLVASSLNGAKKLAEEDFNHNVKSCLEDD